MKRLAITIGDPGGVGPEITVRAVLSPEVQACCRPIIIGDGIVMEEALKLVNASVKIRFVEIPDETIPSPDFIEMIDMQMLSDFEKGRATSEGGKACAGYIRRATEFALDNKVDGIVTAPISKEALKMAGIKWPGHTEMLAELTATENFTMMLVGGPLRVILVTIHTSIKSVPGMITKKNILRTIRLAKKACEMLGIERPRIGVAALNPHAGEAGIFGNEEIKNIVPAMDDAKKEGIPVAGPFPPDTIFNKAYKGEFDIVVCMYHDQGLIPLKMIAFDIGVNVTIGLPFVRTSPDHGTAYDIAWKGIADSSSMIEAIKLAARLKI